MQVALAGSVELICAVGLALGLFTRPIALLGSVYLLMSMLWGGHFHIGYVWALPEGGYEFGVFWAMMIAVFAVLSGGRYSLDRTLWRREPVRCLLPPFRMESPRELAGRLLFSPVLYRSDVSCALHKRLMRR
jgi:putative oxidoreductase